ncbi:hypothetical protein [Pseudaestuariivita rosea]|uniref:hypothetical protein n=1 Tax=Pseudaestuariivita rosea TaxID=2763263 RepID=UPI001ABB101E|nr:hypothetical protein [Pseudaestuariivita rosea]
MLDTDLTIARDYALRAVRLLRARRFQVGGDNKISFGPSIVSYRQICDDDGTDVERLNACKSLRKALTPHLILHRATAQTRDIAEADIMIAANTLPATTRDGVVLEEADQLLKQAISFFEQGICDQKL